MQKIEVVVLILIVIAASIALFLFWQKEKGPTFDLCNTFENVKGEVSCNEAVNFALETYPGEVLSVEKREVKVSVEKEKREYNVDPQTTPPPPLSIEVHTVWFIGLEVVQPIALPENTLKELDVAVDIGEKKILAVFGR